MSSTATGMTMATMSRYAILGCGSVGHVVAEELVEGGKDVLILDRDEGRVEALRDQDLNAQVADIRDQAIVEGLSDRNVVLILSSDVDANAEAVRNIRADDETDHFVVARADDPVSADQLGDLGADVVINPSAVIAESALRALETGELEYKAAQLAEAIDDTGHRMAILIQRSPDPDSIASASALRAIAESRDVAADVIYEGEIGHQENRAFVNLLGLELVSREDVDVDNYDTFAVVDSGKGGGTDVGPVDIVIDHYEQDREIEATFVDIRPNVSATSTIMTKYIQELDLTLDQAVATALLYGIRAETLDFKRDTTPADLTAAAYLYPFADHDTLEQVESPSMSPETLDVLAEAIRNREVRGSHLVSNAGFIRDRDALSRAAQHLLNLEGITTTAVFAIGDQTIYLAARSKDIRMDIGKVLEDAFAEMGETAGHSTDASVEIPLGIFTGIEASESNRDTLLELTEEALKTKLFEAMGVDGANEGSNGG